MWYSKKGEPTKLLKDDLFRLLTYHQQAEGSALDRFAQHKNIMTGAMIAILTAGGASLVAEEEVLHIAVFLLPVFVVYLRRYTIDTLDRYYRRFLEAVVCTKKIWFMLGLHRPVWSEEIDPPLNESLPFKSDEYLDVDRHWREQKDSSNKWIFEFMQRGHNEVVGRLLKAICIGSAIIPLFGAALLKNPILCIIILYIIMAPVVIVLAWLLYISDSLQIAITRYEETFGNKQGQVPPGQSPYGAKPSRFARAGAILLFDLRNLRFKNSRKSYRDLIKMIEISKKPHHSSSEEERKKMFENLDYSLRKKEG